MAIGSEPTNIESQQKQTENVLANGQSGYADYKGNIPSYVQNYQNVLQQHANQRLDSQKAQVQEQKNQRAGSFSGRGLLYSGLKGKDDVNQQQGVLANQAGLAAQNNGAAYDYNQQLLGNSYKQQQGLLDQGMNFENTQSRYNLANAQAQLERQKYQQEQASQLGSGIGMLAGLGLGVPGGQLVGGAIGGLLG